jgi:hypothetical protein
MPSVKPDPMETSAHKATIFDSVPQFGVPHREGDVGAVRQSLLFGAHQGSSASVDQGTSNTANLDGGLSAAPISEKSALAGKPLIFDNSDMLHAQRPGLEQRETDTEVLAGYVAEGHVDPEPATVADERGEPIEDVKTARGEPEPVVVSVPVAETEKRDSLNDSEAETAQKDSEPEPVAVDGAGGSLDSVKAAQKDAEPKAVVEVGDPLGVSGDIAVRETSSSSIRRDRATFARTGASNER